MHFQEILAKKRDGHSLKLDEIGFFVSGYTKGDIPDYQASAFLMAVYLNGLSLEETVWLTDAMLHSGTVVDLAGIKKIKVDKHSTGGVGDKTSLIIAPICASLGIPVPMVSGRGLGHTGGTLDKLEAIPGFNVNITLDRYRALVKEVGCCLIGQTDELAPADKKLYALRDVTCTVENKALIAASIMSKKLAEGIDALVLDVKTGSGAFMKSQSEAEELARLMILIGQKMNKRVTALITDMNQPLGSHVGNALEISEAIALLKGQCLPEQQDLWQISQSLASHMILLAGLTREIGEAKRLAANAVKDGSALQKFKEIINSQGGDASCLENPEQLQTAKKRHLVSAENGGYLQTLDALAIGKGAVYLGAGRATLESTIDPTVGIVLRKKVGDAVRRGEILMEVHYNNQEKLQQSLPFFEKAVTITQKQSAPQPVVKNILSTNPQIL